MGLVISHNLPALNAQNKLHANIAGLSKASEKLSSGYRINSAADDAAGLAVSEKMRSQIRGLNQAKRNAQDAIAYIQTAEGALDSIHSILKRGKELATEAANGTYDNYIDRSAIQLEIDQLCSEINDTSMTDFNGHYVFDTKGATPPDAFRNFTASQTKSRQLEGAIIGEGEDAAIVTYGAVAGVDVGVGTGRFTEEALNDYAQQLKEKYVPKMLAGIVKSLPTSSKPTVDGMTIGFQFFENQSSSTLASVTSNGNYFNLSVNLKYLTQNGNKINMTGEMNSTIAHEMTHAVMFDTVSAGMLGHGAANRFPDWFAEGMAQAVGGSMNYVSEILPYGNCFENAENAKLALDNGVTIDMFGDRPPQDVKQYLQKLKSNGSGSLTPYKQGYLAVMYLGWCADGRKAVTKENIARGLDKVLYDIAGGSSLDTVIGNAGLGNTTGFVNNFGDDASVKFVNDLIAATGAKRALRFDPASGGASVVTIGGTGSIISPNGLSGTKDSLLKISGKSKYFTLELENGRVSSNGKVFGNNITDLKPGISDGELYEGGGTNGGGTPSTHLNPSGNVDIDPDDSDPADPNPGGGGSGGSDGGIPVNPGNWGQPEIPGLTPGSIVVQVGSGTRHSVVFNMSYGKNGIGNLNNDFNCTALGLGIANSSFGKTRSSNNTQTSNYTQSQNGITTETVTYGLRTADGRASTGTTRTAGTPTGDGFTSRGTISVSNQEDANAAIDKFDFAINKVSMMRASFGAAQNRLEHKISNMTVTHENLTEAESGIRDTDMAKSMMDYIKYQILGNSAQSILSQANRLPQGLLSLLG